MCVSRLARCTAAVLGLPLGLTFGVPLPLGVPLAFALAALLSGAPAVAQQAEANLLFDEGRAAMAARDFNAAIAKLEQSQRLDPAVGTLLNLAESYAAVGRSASAWAAYRDAASLAAITKQGERERYAYRKAQELEARLSRLELVVKPDARAPGLTITRGDVAIPEGLWGAAVPVDPGVQHLEAKAPGRTTWTLDVSVADNADRVQVVVPPLALSESAAPPAQQPAAAATPAGTAEPTFAAPLPPIDRAVEPAPPSSLPTAGWISVGVGSAAAVAGVVVFVSGRMQISDANCPDQRCVRGVGDKDLHDKGRAKEKLGVGIGLAGAIVAGAGVALVLSAPRGAREKERSSRPELTLSVAASGVGLNGSW